MKIFKTSEPRYITPVARWGKVRQETMTKRSQCYDYSGDGEFWCCMLGKYLSRSQQSGVFHTLSSFIANTTNSHLSADIIAFPILFGFRVEMGDCCEHARFSKYVEKKRGGDLIAIS